MALLLSPARVMQREFLLYLENMGFRAKETVQGWHLGRHWDDSWAAGSGVVSAL